MTDYQQQLEALTAGEITEILVKKDDFMLFREAWNNHPLRKEIIGEAQNGGDVIYRFRSES